MRLKKAKQKNSFKLWLYIPVIAFICFHPMFISIYVFLPLVIGTMGYYLIEGIHQKKLHYIFFTVVYFINLEVNLSLPFFLTIVASLLVYLFFYLHLVHFRQCRICKAILIVLAIDILYLGMLLGYDMLFGTSSIMLDSIILYSLVVDILLVLVL